MHMPNCVMGATPMICAEVLWLIYVSTNELVNNLNFKPDLVSNMIDRLIIFLSKPK